MKRDELKALELTDEQVNAVMKMYGQSIVELQNGLTAAQQESETAKGELKRYQKGGELFIDKAEHERLKTFETETLTKAEREKKKSLLVKLYKDGGAKESAIPLLLKGQNWDEIDVDDKDNIKNGAELLKTAKAEYADGFGVNGNTGVPHAHEEDGGSSKTTNRQKYY